MNQDVLFQYERFNLLEFNTLHDFVEYIDTKIKETDLYRLRFKFTADVVKVKPYNGSVYITVSQETSDGKKTEMTVIVWRNLAPAVMKNLLGFGIKDWNQLEHKKWEFQGKLSFYPERAQFSFWADSIAPQGESDILSRRQKIKEQLKKEGLLVEVEHNLLELEPIRMIALITSRTAQGYFDFLSNLMVPDNYRPITHLYESSMQGASTSQEVIRALDRVTTFCKKSGVKYDVIVLIRGGGGPSDLMYFDDYELAKHIAKTNAYIPVLTGIGHEKDETIPDYVAWRRFPTPTAVAKEISNQIKTYLESVNRWYSEINQRMDSILNVFSSKVEQDNYKMLSDSMRADISKTEKSNVESASFLLKSFTLKNYETALSFDFLGTLSNNISSKYVDVKKEIDDTVEKISSSLNYNLKNNSQDISNYDRILNDFDRIQLSYAQRLDSAKEELSKIGGPVSALLVGGAVVTKDGKFIKSKEEINEKDVLKINFYDGGVIVKTVDDNNGQNNSK